MLDTLPSARAAKLAPSVGSQSKWKRKVKSSVVCSITEVHTVCFIAAKEGHLSSEVGMEAPRHSIVGIFTVSSLWTSSPALLLLRGWEQCRRISS